MVFGYKIMDESLCSKQLLREILAEIVGTFFLIILGCGGVQAAVMGDVIVTRQPGNPDPVYSMALDQHGKFIQIGLAFGLGIGGAVHLFSDISGGQFNTAVSLGLFCARKQSLYKTAVFSVAQIIGGVIGSGLLKILFKVCPGVVMTHPALPGYGALILEFLGTLFLVLTVLATTNEKRGHAAGYLQPVSIGISILVIHMFLLPLTGCGINPARSFATNIMEPGIGIQSTFYAYILGPLLAALAGGLLYEFLFDPYYTSCETGHRPLNGDTELKEQES